MLDAAYPVDLSAGQVSFEVSGHHGGKGEKVEVVAVVGGIQTRCWRLGEIGTVDLDGVPVGLCGVGVAAYADVDVRRHVDQVTGAGRPVLQPLGEGNRLVGGGAGLHGVDIEVRGSRVVGMGGEHALDSGDKRRRVALRLQIGRPVVPGLQVHQ